VSIGNKADVSTNDLLEWWEEDAATEVILLYVESFGNPRRFGRLARRVARAKPILALKSGTTASGQRAASSHTAALAGAESAVDALFQQAGVIRAASLEELIDVSTLLSSPARLSGRSVAMLTNAGGLGILCADACESAGLELSTFAEETVGALRAELPAEASVANPVDMLGSATAETYADVLPHLLADPHVSAVIVLFVPAVSATAEEVAEAIERAARRTDADKPVLAVVMSSEGVPEVLRRSPTVPAFVYPESAARALGRAAERAEWLRRPLGTVPVLEGIDRQRAEEIATRKVAEADDTWLEPGPARELLLAYGIPVVGERLARSAEEAVAAARELGFPSVVKTATAGAHKTETEGIALDLEDEDAVEAALARIGAPVVVQPMLRGGAEFLAGVVQDPVFGPLVAFGPGGVFAELIGDAGFRIAPLTDIDAEELVLGGKAGRLVAGFRGAPASDSAALMDLLHRLSRLGEDLPAVAELDLNPVLGLGEGCVAVDARVRVRRSETVVRAKTW
jgi:acyl-CoA synthetase (NDP forming)